METVAFFSLWSENRGYLAIMKSPMNKTTNTAGVMMSCMIRKIAIEPAMSDLL